jgi:hypothetical protein
VAPVRILLAAAAIGATSANVAQLVADYPHGCQMIHSDSFR